MDDFKIFQYLLDRVSELLNSFVNEAAGNAISAISPFVIVAFMIAILWYSYKVMFGQIEQPVSQLIMKCLVWSLVMSAALSAGAYQSNIAGIVQTLPNDVAAAVAPGGTTSDGTLGSLLDTIVNTGINKAKEVWRIKTGRFDFGGAILYKGIGAGILLWTLLITITGFMMLMLATVAVAFLAAIGPFFIAALLFDSTRNFFWTWVSQVLYWVAYMVLFALCALFILNLYKYYIDEIVTDRDNLIPAVLTINVVSLFGFVIFFMIPRIASGLTGGVGGSMVGAVGGLVRTAITTVAMVKTFGAAAGLKMAGTAAGMGSARGAASVAAVTRGPPRGYNRM